MIFELIPSVNEILLNSELCDSLDKFYLKKLIRNQIEEIKTKLSPNEIKKLKNKSDVTNFIIEKVNISVNKVLDTKTKHIINATGIILNTNLGRSRLPKEILENIYKNFSNYLDLEQDILTSKRKNRVNNIIDLLKFITDCQSALVVNNAAAALMLTINTLSKNKNVIIARSELIEIGGSFRLPDIIEASSGKLLEIGTTNKTKIKDYQKAAQKDNIGLILKCHRSNFDISGFVEDVTIDDLKSIKLKAPIVYDIGSGIFSDLLDENQKTYLEPFLINNKIINKSDITIFSGDKLLGACQCGIILGKKKHIDKLKENPIYRTLRLDKIHILILEEILLAYLNKSSLKHFPNIKNLTCNLNETKKQIAEFSNNFNHKHLQLLLKDSKAYFGGGSISEKAIDSISINLTSKIYSANQIDEYFRKYSPSIIGTIRKNIFYLNLISVEKEELEIILNAIEKFE